MAGRFTHQLLLAAAALAALLAAGGGAPAEAAAPPPAAAPAARSVMDLGATHPDLTRVLGVIRNDDDLAAYLADPDTVCTFFAADNAAMQRSLRDLGKYVGIASQDAKLQRATFNYHVIPGKALTAQALMGINDTATRANETLWVTHHGGKPYIYSRPDFTVGLNQTDIKAGKCIVHTIDMNLVPPSAIPQVNKWLKEIGTLPPPQPRELWGASRTPQHEALVKESEALLARNGSSAGRGAAGPGAEPADAAPSAPAAAPAPAPAPAAKSAAGPVAAAAPAAVLLTAAAAATTAAAVLLL